MKTRLRRTTSACGTSLVEMLIATALLGILMAAAYGSLISQMRTHATQTMVSETMLAARSALAVLTAQIDAAGLGVPHATQPSTAAALITTEPQRLTFWADVPARHTYLATSAAKASTQLAVQSSAGLVAGSTIYIATSDNWQFATVVTVANNTLTIDTPLAYGFAAGSPIMPVERVTFELVKGALVRNGHAVIEHVRDLTFTYDAVKLDAIRVIGIRLTVETRSIDPRTGAPLPITVQTAVTPVNLSL